jgi:hypothetical protein
MIVWIASYPKSGNTLLRSILSTYFYSKDGILKFKYLDKISQFPQSQHFLPLGIDIENEVEVFKNFINAQNLINENKEKLKFFKTHSSLCKMHNCNYTDLKNTLGAIYIVRDPRNVVTSLSHHFSLNIDEATEAILDNNRFMERTLKTCKVFLGSWSSNYNSWKELEKPNKYLLIKYEDLINKKKAVMLKIFKFLVSLGVKLEIDMIKLNKSIKTTEFDYMKNKELNETFSEALIDSKTGKKKNFFNLGPKNDWRKYLDQRNKEKIEKLFDYEMRELGYL